MFKILKISEYSSYINHVKENMKNSRTEDDTILEKISNALTQDKRVIIFAEVNEKGKILRSVMTIKRIVVYEYLIINIRSSTKFFDRKKFLELFDFIFQYYEKQKYYRWILARPIDLLSPRAFNNLYLKFPFTKYETAIEAHSSMANFEKTFYYTDLLCGIPKGMSIDKFIIISGFCKQSYRNFENNIEVLFV